MFQISVVAQPHEVCSQYQTINTGIKNGLQQQTFENIFLIHTHTFEFIPTASYLF